MGTVSLYVHIPFCKRRCPYCSFYHVRPGSEGEFVEALAAEARSALGSLQTLTPRRRVSTVYFGGGTPSVLSPAAWARISEAIAPRGQPRPSEVTCEVNPEDVTDEALEMIGSRGVNRLSIGVQSMDADAQRLLGRCPPRVNRLAIERALRRFTNVNFDVLLGVPRRSIASLDRTLDELAAYRPAHFSVYCLEPGGDMGGAADGFFDAVDVDRTADEYLRACERLEQAGYRHYEVSSFAMPGLECAHNRVYWDGGEYLGLGPAAHSYIDGRRFHNPASLDGYLASAHRPAGDRWVFDEVGPKERELERWMLSLRTDSGVALEACGCPEATISAILEDGLAEIAGGRLRLTDRGYLLLNEVALRLSRGRRYRRC